MRLYKNGSLKEKTDQQRWKCSKEMKSNHPGGAIWINVSEITEEIAARGNVDTASGTEWRQT